MTTMAPNPTADRIRDIVRRERVLAAVRAARQRGVAGPDGYLSADPATMARSLIASPGPAIEGALSPEQFARANPPPPPPPTLTYPTGPGQVTTPGLPLAPGTPGTQTMPLEPYAGPDPRSIGGEALAAAEGTMAGVMGPNTYEPSNAPPGASAPRQFAQKAAGIAGSVAPQIAAGTALTAATAGTGLPAAVAGALPFGAQAAGDVYARTQDRGAAALAGAAQTAAAAIPLQIATRGISAAAQIGESAALGGVGNVLGGQAVERIARAAGAEPREIENGRQFLEGALFTGGVTGLHKAVAALLARRPGTSPPQNAPAEPAGPIPDAAGPAEPPAAETSPPAPAGGTRPYEDIQSTAARILRTAGARGEAARQAAAKTARDLRGTQGLTDEQIAHAATDNLRAATGATPAPGGPDAQGPEGAQAPPGATAADAAARAAGGPAADAGADARTTQQGQAGAGRPGRLTPTEETTDVRQEQALRPPVPAQEGRQQGAAPPPPAGQGRGLPEGQRLREQQAELAADVQPTPGPDRARRRPANADDAAGQGTGQPPRPDGSQPAGPGQQEAPARPGRPQRLTSTDATGAPDRLDRPGGRRQRPAAEPHPDQAPGPADPGRPDQGARPVRPARAPQRGEWSRADIDRRIVSAAERTGLDAVNSAIDTDEMSTGQDISLATRSATLPTEIREALEGKPHLRRFFETNKRGGRLEDQMADLGVDRIIAHAEELAGNDSAKAREHLRKMAAYDPEANFLTWLRDNQPGSARLREKWEVLDRPAEHLEEGDTLKINGRPFDVVEDNGYRMLRELDDDGEPAGMLVHLDALDSMPVDKGTINQREAAAPDKPPAQEPQTSAEAPAADHRARVAQEIGDAFGEKGSEFLPVLDAFVAGLPKDQRGKYWQGLRVVKGGRAGEAALLQENPNAPVWYSKLRRTAEEKMGGAMDAQQLRKMLENAGVKPEELEWARLHRLSGKVTKQQLLDHLDEHAVRVEEVHRGDSVKDSLSPTKFQSYQVPGGTDYRELLLTLPDRARHERIRAWATKRGIDNIMQAEQGYDRDVAAQRLYHKTYDDLAPELKAQVDRDIREDRRGALGAEPPGNFTASHWSEPNVLAHVRFNTRHIYGKKVLFLEEIQSDWHQKGRDQGYATPRTNGAVPDAPFKKNWHELAMKRMIRYAADNGYDQIAWTHGDIQNDRYDLSKQVDSIDVGLEADGKTYWINANKNGRAVVSKDGLQPQELADHIGKDLAKRAIADLERKTFDEKAAADYKQVADAAREFIRQEEIAHGQPAFYIAEDRTNAAEPFVVRRVDTGAQVSRYATETEASHSLANFTYGFRRSAGEITPAMKEAYEAYEATYNRLWKHREDAGEFPPGSKERAKAERSTRYSGLDLKLGGEGMRGFYDKILVNDTNKLIKKHGGKVGQLEFPAGSSGKNYRYQGPTDLAQVHQRMLDAEQAGESLIKHQLKKALEATEHTDDFEIPRIFGQELSERAAEWIGGKLVRKPEIITTHGFDITPAMREDALKGMPLFQGPHASYEITAAGNRIIRALQDPNAGSLPHEVSHDWLEILPTMDPAMGRRAYEALGVPEGQRPTPAQHERFARGFERFMREGKAPTYQLKQVFQKFKTWLTDLYRSIRGTPLEGTLNPELRSFFNDLLSRGAKEAAGGESGETTPPLSVSEIRRRLRTMGHEHRGTADDVIDRWRQIERGEAASPYVAPPPAAEVDTKAGLRLTAEHVSNRPGWSVEHNSDSGSVYARHGASGALVRLSDHHIPGGIGAPDLMGRTPRQQAQPWQENLVNRRTGDLRGDFDRVATEIEADLAASTDTAARVGLVDPAKGPVEEPPAETPAPEADTTGPDPWMTSARETMTTDDRKAMGLDELDSPERRSWQQAIDTARARGLNSPEKAMRLAAEINAAHADPNAEPRALNDIETAGMVEHTTRLKNEHRGLLKELEALPERSTEYGAKAAELNRVEEEFDSMTRALRASGTEKGRALAAQKLTLNQDYDLVSVKARARAAKGKPLTEGESAKITELTRQLEETTAKLNAMEKANYERDAAREVRLHKSRRRGVSRDATTREFDFLLYKAKRLLEAGC